MSTVPPVLNKIIQLLLQNKANFTLLNHAAEGKSEVISKIRGTPNGAGAKAIVCEMKKLKEPLSEGVKALGLRETDFILLILSGDLQVDYKKLASFINCKKISMAKVDAVLEVTGCVPGSVPPFSFDEHLKILCDGKIFDRFDEICFNAGSLEHSLKIKSSDYLRIVDPLLGDFSKSEQ